MAARSRSIERSRGLASRLFTGVSACLASLLEGVSSAAGRVSISGLPETVLGGAGETVSGKKRRAGSGSGFQPSRRRPQTIILKAILEHVRSSEVTQYQS